MKANIGIDRAVLHSPLLCHGRLARCQTQTGDQAKASQYNRCRKSQFHQTSPGIVTMSHRVIGLNARCIPDAYARSVQIREFAATKPLQAHKTEQNTNFLGDHLVFAFNVQTGADQKYPQDHCIAI